MHDLGEHNQRIGGRSPERGASGSSFAVDAAKTDELAEQFAVCLLGRLRNRERLPGATIKATARREAALPVAGLLSGRPDGEEPMQLGAREDCDAEARLFADSGADALRTSIAKACRAAGVPVFSPHDLRHRRISGVRRAAHPRMTEWRPLGAPLGREKCAISRALRLHPGPFRAVPPR